MRVAVEKYAWVLHRLSLLWSTFLDGFYQLVDFQGKASGRYYLLFHSFDRGNDGSVITVENLTDAGERHVGDLSD